MPNIHHTIKPPVKLSFNDWSAHLFLPHELFIELKKAEIDATLIGRGAKRRALERVEKELK